MNAIILRMIDFKKTSFLKSAEQLSQCPKDDLLEIAFIGRSNAGKSSAINRLTFQKKLAKTSKTPGRTQLINFFQINENFRLVDLPGYGYAHVAKNVKKTWEMMINNYLCHRENLRGIVLIMDIRHPLKPFDQQMIHWAIAANLPIHILLTKADKLSRNQQNSTYLQLQTTLKLFHTPISSQIFSATSDLGLEELENKLNNFLAN